MLSLPSTVQMFAYSQPEVTLYRVSRAYLNVLSPPLPIGTTR